MLPLPTGNAGARINISWVRKNTKEGGVFSWEPPQLLATASSPPPPSVRRRCHLTRVRPLTGWRKADEEPAALLAILHFTALFICKYNPN